MSAYRQNYTPAPAAPAWPGQLRVLLGAVAQAAAVIAGAGLLYVALVVAMAL